MATNLEGAALGPPFQMLFDYMIRIPVEKGLVFKEEFEDIRTRLEALDPMIKEIVKSNMVLDRPKSVTIDFALVMEQGSKLVSDCWEVRKWYYAYKWPGCTTKLQKLRKSLDRLLTILGAQTALDTTKIRIKLDEMDARRSSRAEISNGLVPRQVEVELEGGWEVPQVPDFTVGLDKPLNDLKVELLKGDRSVLVVTAPGGCGKTTLAKKLCLDADIRERFKGNTMFVKVSKTPNLNHIVQELYQYNGRKMPFLQDEEGAFMWLERLLREIGQSPMLLVLDDVWSESATLIEKFSFNIPGYKILVTSRFKFPKFEPAYELEVLNDSDAMKLFCHYAFLDGGSPNIRDDLVKEVVQRCKRFPLALKLIGSSLSGERREIWQRELKKWSKDSSVLKSKTELLRCLQSSLDVLGEKDPVLKECFLDLGSFPEDRRIPATALIDIWTELNGLEEDDASSNIFCLKKWNLANVVITRKDVDEEDDYYSEYFVTQHDMLRELAIHQSERVAEGQKKRLIVELTGNKLPEWRKEHKDQTFNVNLVAISTDGSFSSEWCDIKLPEAKVLVLNFQTKNYALPGFVKNMTELKVLIITNYGFFAAELGDFQLLGSLTKLTRIRLERISIPCLRQTSIVLKKLQKLSLFMCELGHAFSSIKISEVLPNLVEINIDYCDDLVELPAGLCDLIKLKKLSITHCHNMCALPEEIGNLDNLEVLRLRSCIDLERLPDSISKLTRLTFLDISDCFSIRNLPEQIGELQSLTNLNMKNCSRLLELPPSVLDLKELKVVVCDEELKELWEFYLPIDANIELRSVKDEVNLNWLENHRS
ncbi:Powdery mildew resistance protein [Parasponia andersonii]|uniref:Powdery mildew resistance protein n=1 Tax=Parasponia andersonii TaxID=3476 RepID=A0A2P5ADI5_PARAD|nr:Powdery mildew resistance protein [Parasponia andersonii]